VSDVSRIVFVIWYQSGFVDLIKRFASIIDLFDIVIRPNEIRMLIESV